MLSQRLPDFPSGYAVRNINFGVELLGSAFPQHYMSVCRALEAWTVSWSDVITPGGNLSIPSKKFVSAFGAEGWEETEFRLETRLQDRLTIARTHKIDLFKAGLDLDNPYPGIGIELEWNNKDEFFDRDLINFEALHRARGLAVGILVTRGPSLQAELVSRGDAWRRRFGSRTTHWEKLEPRLDLGRGGATPIVAFGLEASRVQASA
jgi:hypothetical protein